MFAALHLPDLEIAAALRLSPESRGHPCGVISPTADPDASKEKLPLLAVNPLPHNIGILAGWPLNRALVRCPGLKILPRQPLEKANLLRELIELAESLTPDLEITAPDTLILDLSRASNAKIALLDEFEIPHAELWHARAPTPDLAHLAVLNEESQGGLLNKDYFARLPLRLLGSLPGTAALLPILHLWGLRTMADFMKLPRQDLAERLGPIAGHSHDVLHGKTCRLLHLHRPPDSFGQSHDFEDPIHLTEPLVFAANRLLHTLSARVAAKYLAVATLEITLILERGKLHRTLRLPEPLAAAHELLLPIQTFLESLHLDSPVIGIDLDATVVPPSPTQREWHGKQLPNPSRWADTLARLEALLGRENVGIPIPENTHRPDSFHLLSPLDSQPLQISPHRPDNSVPLRRFRPPQPIAVASEFHNHLPVPLAILNGQHPGEILSKRGPFILSGDWWETGKTWRRLEWDIQLPDRRLFRLAFSPPDHWQLEGTNA